MIVFAVLLMISYCMLFIWLTDGLRKNNPSSTFDSKADLPGVSVVISARNEENNIDTLCKSLSMLNYPHENLEIIIVNDRSTDNTAISLKSWEEKVDNLNVIQIKHTPIGWAPKKWALNEAISKSKYDIILQTDADCQFGENWINSMVQPFANSQTGFVSGPAPLTHANALINSMTEMESLSMDAFFAGVIRRGIPMSCTGRNMGFRKIAFNQVGGYQDISDQISGDDDLLLQKIASGSNWSVEFVANPSAIVESPAPDSLETFILQRLRFASKGFKYYGLPTTAQIKMFLPYLFISNAIVMISITQFISGSDFVWVLPFIFKIFADGLITLIFYNEISRKWSITGFSIMSLLHPFYVVIFAVIAPFSQLKWKDG